MFFFRSSSDGQTLDSAAELMLCFKHFFDIYSES